jgi:hypothetical protein
MDEQTFLAGVAERLACDGRRAERLDPYAAMSSRQSQAQLLGERRLHLRVSLAD